MKSIGPYKHKGPTKPIDPITLITESDFTRQVIDLAHVYHWKVAHFRAAMTKHGWRTPVQADGKGFPDLVMVRKNRLIFAELKSEKGKMSDEQIEWACVLRATTIEIYDWRHSQFQSIQQVLK